MKDDNDTHLQLLRNLCGTQMFRWKGSLFIETHVKGRNKTNRERQLTQELPWLHLRWDPCLRGGPDDSGQFHMKTSLGSLSHPFPVGDEGASGLNVGDLLRVH